MDGIDKLYQGLSAVYDLGTPEDFRAKIADEQHRKNLYDQISGTVDLGVADYNEFSKKVNSYIQPRPEFPNLPDISNPIPTFGNDATRQDQTRMQDYETRIPEEVKQHNAAVERRMEELQPQHEAMWAQDKPLIDEIYQQAQKDANDEYMRAAQEYSVMPINVNGGEISNAMNMARRANEKRDPAKLIAAFNSRLDERMKERFPDMKDTTPASDSDLAFQLGKTPEDYQLYKDYVMRQLQQYFTDVNMPKSQLEYFARKVIQGNILGQLYEIGTKPLAQRQYEMQGLQQYASQNNTTGADIGAEITNVVTDPLMWLMPGVGGLAGKAVVGRAGRKLLQVGLTDAAGAAERAALQRGILRTAKGLTSGGVMMAGIDTGHTLVGQLYQSGEVDWKEVGKSALRGAATGVAFGTMPFLGERVQKVIGDAYGRSVGLVAGRAAQFTAGTNIMVGSSVLSHLMNGGSLEDVDWGSEYAHAAAMQLFFDVQGGLKTAINAKGFGNAWRLMKQDPTAHNLSKEEIEQFNAAGIQGKDAYNILKNLNGGKDFTSVDEYYKVLNDISANENIDTQAKYKLASLLYGKVDANLRPIYTSDVIQDEQGRYVVRTFDNGGMPYETRYFTSKAKAEEYRQKQYDETRNNMRTWQEGVVSNYQFAQDLQDVADQAIIELQKQYPQYSKEQLYSIMREALLNPNAERGRAIAQNTEAAAIRGMFEEYLASKSKTPAFFNILSAVRAQAASDSGISAKELGDIISRDYSNLDYKERGIYDNYLRRLAEAMPNPTSESTRIAGELEAGGPDDYFTSPQQQPVQPTRDQMIRQEVEEEVASQTHNNGYVYPVKQAGVDGKAGFIVGNGEVVVDTTNPEGPRISNDDIVTVKYEDGTVEQVSARKLDLLSTPEPADNIVATLTEQRLAAEAQQEAAEQAAQNLPEGVVEFTNGNETMAVVDNGDGTYQLLNSDGTPNVNSISAEQLAENGYAMIPREQASEQPAVAQEPQQPATPALVVPNIDTMSADELGGATVEYMGDKASATAYLEAERDKADAEVKRTAKLKVGRFDGIEDFKRQNDQIQAAKRAAIDRYNKIQSAITAVNAYKTQAELQEEAERKAREAAMREQRRQLAEAEAAGDIEAKWQNTKKTIGFAATKTLPNGQKVNGHYILTEAGAVIPSHDPRKNYADSEGYVMENGQNVNDNNYKDPEVQKIANDIAQNYGGQAVEQMPFLENKAGRVLSGNNRTISGIIAAENNTDQAYLAALAENAQQYGFTPEQLAEYQHPRLQFVVEDELPFTTGTFAMFNQQEKKTKSSVNRAIANSKMVTEAVRDKMLEVMDQYDSLDSFFGSENAAADIVQSLISEGLMTQQEVAGLTESTGTGFKFSQSGREYVTDMLLGTLFDEQTIRMLAGEKTLKQAILRALPSIVENRRLKGYELTESINKAVQILYEARKANEGKSTADAFQLFLRQVDAFQGKVTDRFDGFDIILANRMSAGVEQLREMLNLYNNSARDEANGQMGFFEPRSSEDIKQDVYEYYTKQQPDLAAALNGAAEEGAQSQSPVSSGTANAGEVRPTQREQLTEYLNGIADDEHPFELFDDASTEELLRSLGASEESIERAKIAVANGAHVNGIKYKGRIYLNADECNTPELARTNYVHERQHLLTTKADLDRVFNAVGYQELNEIVDALAKHSGFYLGRDFNELADEFISFGMEAAYRAENDAELEATLREVGANDELVNIIKSINNEQRASKTLSKGRRNPVYDNRSASSSPESGRDQTAEPAGVGGQGTGVDQRSLRPTEGRGNGVPAAGEVTDKIVPERPNSKQLQGMSYNVAEAEDYIGRVVRNILDENGYNDVEIVGTKVIGSRVNGNAREDSDLDAIVEFKGNAREDSLFNLFAGENIELDGVKVDINPITEGKSGTIEQFMRRSDEYLAEKNAESVLPKTPDASQVEHPMRSTYSTETEIGGALVDRLEDMGVSVSTDLQANRDALKAAKADKSDAGAIHYYKTPSGQQYGFSYKGKVYLDPTKINAELPLHEYGHLWAEALRRLNPENWQHVVDTIKADKDAWEFVKSLRPELTDENEMAEEVIATFSGKKGAERLKAEYDRMHGKDADYKSKWGNIFKNISKAIQDFWKAVGDFLNIKYESAEQVYDQVLKDFVDNMNPWKRVSDFLRQRDAEYVQAAESGDIKTATNIFYEALKENIGNGITPYMSVGTYNNLKRLAKGVKTRDKALIKEAADLIAPLIPDNAVLIPAPSHSGTATDMLDLAKAIAEVTGSEVADVLRSAPRESQYQAKKTTGVPMASKQLGIAVEGEIPADKTPIIIDNVVDSGNTAEACVQAVGKGVVVTLADSAEQYGHAASLKSAAPVLRDKDGKVIPLSKRFDLSGSRYLGRRMYLRPDVLRLSVSGTQTIPVGKNTLVGLHNISAEKLRKAIKMGGLANPSTAVIDIARQNHEQYGDISLIMPSSLVDSKTGRNAGTFTGDIWSPTYPSVERIMSDKGDDNYYQTITKLFANNEARQPILSRIKLDFDDYLDSGNVRAGLAYWYLLEKGIEPGDVYFNSGISDDIKERFRPLYDKGILDLTKEDYRTLLSLIAEQQGKTAEDMLQDAQESKARYQQTIDDPEAKQFYKKFAQQAIDEIDLYGVRYNVLSNGYHAMERAIREDGKIDLTSTLIAAQDIVQTQYQSDFDKWLSDMDKRFDIKEVLFEDYDRDGNRIYKPHTLANASRMMNKEDLQNAGDHSGLGATRGQLVERMETLADIRANKERLRPGAEEDFETEEWNKMQDEWFNKVLNPLAEMQKISDNPFSQVGYAETRLQEALRTKDPIATLNKEYGYKIDPKGEWAKNLKDLVQRIKSLPTKYFETKFRRPVYLDEFRNAVVPNDLPTELRDGLEKAGLTLFEYDPKEEGARRAATLQATEDEGIRFSVSGGLDADRTLTKAAREEMQQIKDAALADGTFMKAPNGKRSNLNERQWLQVRTRAFQRMFGDWQNDPENATKVLDENGEPMVVYHRTNNKFTAFDPDRARENSNWPTADFGFYFSNVNERGHYGSKSMPVFLNIRNPREIDVDYYADFDYNYKHADPEEMRKDNDGLQINVGRLILDEKATKIFVAYNPNQIKSATHNDGSFSEENDDIRFSVSNASEEIFFSNAERAVESIKQEKATPAQWLAMIEKAGGLKAGEDKWIGLSDWLKAQHATVEMQPGETRSQYIVRLGEASKKFTISKQDILDYIRANKIQIEEVEYGEYDMQDAFEGYRREYKQYYDEAVADNAEDPQEVAWQRMIDEHGDDFDMGFYAYGDELQWDADSDYVKWELENSGESGLRPIDDTRMRYTTHGLQNKREIALVVPTIESWNEDDEIHFGDAGEGRAVAWVRFGDTHKIKEDWTDGEGNLHKGAEALEDVLVIDEIQSKRHQEGREKGYKEPNQYSLEEVTRLHDIYDAACAETEKYRISLAKKYDIVELQRSSPKRIELRDLLNEEETAELNRLEAAEETAWQQYYPYRDGYYANKKSNQPAPAPFEKNWHELAMKRILRFAAENGYDKVAWTTGEQQAERYDIGKEIDHIVKTDDHSYEVYPTHGLMMNLDFDEDGIYRDDSDREYNGKSMSDIFGKELAKRLQEMPVDETLQGDGLRVGYDGMKGFYDEMLPRFMQKYGKKWGVQVGEVTMPDLEQGYQTMHSVDITPEMRESVLQGQPMFSVTGSRGAANIDKMEGVTTRMDNLAAARQMEEDGKDAKTIRMATGWERGADGKWRYEIDDVQLNADNVKDNFRKLDRRGVTAPMVWYHNKFTDIIADSPERKQLLAAYPQFADLDIEFYDYPNKERGAYSSEKKKISVNRANVRSVDECRSVLLHEIQHAIQEAELFAKGTSKEQIQLTWKLNNEVHNKVDEYFDKMGFKEWLASHNGDKAFVDRLMQVIHMFPNRDFNIHYLFVETLPRDKQIDAIDVLGDANDVIQSNRDAIYGADRKGMTMKPDELYHNAAGEVESRNVQNRMNLTPEERRERLLAETEDVAREDQIVIMNAFDMANDDATPRGTMDAQPGENKVQYAARIAEEIKRENPKDTSLDEAIRFSITVNHNSPYLLKRADGAFVDPETGERLGFDLRFIGKGEGGQAHGYGSYFSKNDIRSYGEGYGFSIRDIKDAFDTSRWQSFGVGDAFDVAKGYLLEAHSEKAPSLRKWLEDRLAQKQELLKNYEGKVANTAEEDLMVFRAEADVQYIPALLRDMVNDIDTRNRHHYSVDIPDNTGENYLEEDKQLTQEQVDRLREQAKKDGILKDIKGFLYCCENLEDYPFRKFLSDITTTADIGGAGMTDKEASEFLSRAGFVGIHYDGRRDGECYVIFNPDDAVITDHIRFSVTGGINDHKTPVFDTKNTPYLDTQTPGVYTQEPPVDDSDDQIRSDKFKAWFGDWQNDPEHASKVVDESGKPLVVYHATPAEFTTFEPRYGGRNTGDAWLGKGMYFSDFKSDYYGKNIMPVYLNMRKPADISGDNWKKFFEEHLEDFTVGYKGHTYKEYLEDTKDKYDYLALLDKYGLAQYLPPRDPQPYDVRTQLRRVFDKYGYDGVIADGAMFGKDYVVFDPNQIKSATENNGEFSKDNDDIRFSVNNPSTLSRSETVTKALVQQANNNYNIMQSALKKVTADLKGIRAAMRMQSDYDRKVVDALLNLYNTLLQENGVWAQYMPDTTRRIATQFVHAIGKQNITEEVNTIMDHMVHAQAKAAQRQWDKLRQTPIDKINISGVVMQGKVALEGQHALKAMNDALQANLTIEQIEEQINQLMDMEDNATDESLKTQYKGQWIGLTIAAQHLERLQHLQEERQQLDLELQSARSNKALKPAARRQLVDNIKQAMRDNYIEQAEAYTRSTQDLSEYVNTQEGRAKDFIRRQDANRDKIRSYAQRDLEGLATNPNRNRTKGNVARSIWDAFASPIRDLQSLLRLTGLHAPDGEGYLYNHFMRNWMDGADMERTGIVAASKTLDEKIAELTHGKYKTWEEAARKINDASHNLFGITMLNGVDGKDMPVTEEIPLNAGNALYIYAVNKMNDGRMKLNGMNITEEDVQALADKVRKQFGQEILDVVDWVQSEFFSQLRNRYNPTHEALFGAPMDAIENYFPLRINANARQQNEDLSEPDTDAARLLAGTSTGAIKRRTRNSLPLDVRNADFFQEVIRHISQMERWNAFAQWNRDANILFSDINFRNRIKGMKGTIYGEGDKLYNYMKDAFRVAIGTYKPNADGFSKEILNAAKGVTSAKINFRVFTALKQIASFPAFFTYMQDGTFVMSYLRNWLTPHSTMKWAKENLPNFEKRVSKRDMGDMRLMSRSTDWQWNKRILEWSSKYGMFFNVFFDTLTCATGARAVYDSHLADYMKKGYSEEDARNRARQDAEQAFNTSQQSSEGAFMSAVQQDRNLVTAALTVFRTSPIQYTRNFFYHTRNLLRKFGEGRKEEQIAFRMGQYKNDGLNDEQARKAAEKDYNKSLRQDIVGFVVYGALLNILWRLAGQIPYLLLGDDDDKKKQILDDATSGGAWFSPFTGLLGGGIVESALDGNGSVADMFAPEMPFTQDIKRAGQYLSNDKYAEFASQALSVLMQSGTGFDPLTASDMISRIVTTLDSEEELDAATQALRVSQALLSIPQSQYEQMLIDKVVSGETDEDAALEDYIRYQKIHTAPLTWWLRGEESDEKAEENAEKRFNKLLTDRDKIKNPEDYEE